MRDAASRKDDDDSHQGFHQTLTSAKCRTPSGLDPWSRVSNWPRIHTHRVRDPTTRLQRKGFAGIWTQVAGFKVQSANHYTTKPSPRDSLQKRGIFTVFGYSILYFKTAIWSSCFKWVQGFFWGGGRGCLWAPFNMWQTNKEGAYPFEFMGKKWCNPPRDIPLHLFLRLVNCLLTLVFLQVLQTGFHAQGGGSNTKHCEKWRGTTRYSID